MGLISRRIFSSGVDLVGILVQIRDDAVVPVKGGGPLQLHKKVGEEDIAGAFDHEHQARDCWILSCRALVLGTKPASRITSRTRSLVSGRTSGRSLITREIVLTEQPLIRAISLIVMLPIAGIPYL